MDFDVIVIGAGPGGYPAAIRAAQLGAKTAIIEREWLGGTCLNCGCIPTKTLIAGAEVYQKILHADTFGINVGTPEIDYPAMKTRKDGVVDTLKSGIDSLLKAHGVTVFEGEGSFRNANTIGVKSADGSTQEISGKNIIIATGSTSTVPGFIPKHERIVESRAFLDLEELPESLLVLGGGYIGCELACMAAGLGVKVTVVELLADVLMLLDKDVRQVVKKSMKKELGMTLLTGAAMENIAATDSGVTATAGDAKLEADMLLVAIALNFAILQPTATLADGSAIKTTMPTAEDAKAEETTHSADDVARELTNPNSSLATLTLKNQYRWYTGDLPDADDQDNFTMVFQPVFPLSLPKDGSGDNRTVFIRPGIPLLFDQPVPSAEDGGFDWDGVSALGDIGFDLSYGVSKKSGLLWAFGMVGTLPTATDDDVAGKQVRLGPEALLAKFEKWGLYGFFPSHQWDVTGWSDETFSTTQFQPVLTFILSDGYTAGTSPIGFYNWESSEWTVPVNLFITKTVMLGKTPWKFKLDANYYVEQPDAFGPEWMIGFEISPVVNNPFQKMFNSLIGAN